VPFAEATVEFAERTVEFAEATVEFAEATVEFAEATVEFAEATVEFAEATVEFAEATVEFAEATVEFAEATVDFAVGAEPVKPRATAAASLGCGSPNPHPPSRSCAITGPAHFPVLNPQQLSAQSASDVQGPVINCVPAARERDMLKKKAARRTAFLEYFAMLKFV